MGKRCMKPLKLLTLRTCLRVALPITVAMPAMVAALTPPTPQRASVDNLIASLPPPSADKLWIKVREPVALSSLSGKLKVSDQRLAELNDVEFDHQFRQGDWLIVPAKQANRTKWIAALDSAELRRTPPLQDLPPLEDAGPVVRLGDTVKKVAQRYGMTLQQLIQLNPGLDTAKLAVGSQINVAQASANRPRLLLGISPTGSGGLSWPELPDFGNGDKRFGTPSETGWIWPTQGMFSSGYGWRWGRMHKGIDVANNVGTAIVAAKPGRVVFSGWDDGGYGYKVLLQHPDGSQSLYAHNSRLAVRVGQMVEQGQLISYMGSTGRSTGPHLHFEIHPAGQGAMNPLQFLPPRA